MSDRLIKWEAKLIELVGELHSCERRRKEIESLHGHDAHAVNESRRSATLKRQVSNLMDLFPDVEPDLAVLEGVPHWRYEEFSIEPIKSLFGTKYRVLMNGTLMKTTRSLRKAKKELRMLLRNRILVQVSDVMT